MVTKRVGILKRGISRFVVAFSTTRKPLKKVDSIPNVKARAPPPEIQLRRPRMYC